MTDQTVLLALPSAASGAVDEALPIREQRQQGESVQQGIGIGKMSSAAKQSRAGQDEAGKQPAGSTKHLPPKLIGHQDG